MIERRRPNQIAGYALRGYDQGVGRVLWFASCGQVDKVIEAIQSFSNTRHNDLWGGIGLACAYAGGVPIEELRPLFDAAGEEAPALLQGICFAVTARYRAGNVLPHTEEIAAAFLNMTPGEAAALSDRLEKNLPEDQAVEAYEIWRQRLQNEFGPSSGP